MGYSKPQPDETNVYVRWRSAKAAFAEPSHAPGVQEDFSDGIGEHKDISDLVKDQKDVLLLSGWVLFRCKTLDLLIESATQEAQRPGWAQNQVFTI